MCIHNLSPNKEAEGFLQLHSPLSQRETERREMKSGAGRERVGCFLRGWKTEKPQAWRETQGFNARRSLDPAPLHYVAQQCHPHV